jgi:hypothetical protein
VTDRFYFDGHNQKLPQQREEQPKKNDGAQRQVVLHLFPERPRGK